MKETVHIEEPEVARFLFASPAAAPIWLVARLWLGYQWLQAGWEKIWRSRCLRLTSPTKPEFRRNASGSQC